MTRELRDTGSKIAGCALFVEVDGDKSSKTIQETTARAALEFMIAEANKLPDPPKPISAEERWRLVAKIRVTMDGNTEYMERDEFLYQIRNAESAAWNRAVDAAIGKMYSLECWHDSAKIAVTLQRHAIEPLKGKCHEVKP